MLVKENGEKLFCLCRSGVRQGSQVRHHGTSIFDIAEQDVRRDRTGSEIIVPGNIDAYIIQ